MRKSALENIATKLMVVTCSLFVMSCVNNAEESFGGLAIEEDGVSFVYVYSANTGCIDLGQMNTDILVNGVRAFRLRENSFALLRMKPGSYEFTASTDDQIACNGNFNPGLLWPPVELEMESASSYFLQYNGRSQQCISTCDRHLKEVKEDLAIIEMMNTREVEVEQ